MKEQHMLSSQEYSFLKSQEVLLSNKSETLSRIAEKATNCIRTLEIILNSRELEESFVQKNFPIDNVTELYNLLTIQKTPYPGTTARKYQLELSSRLIRLAYGFYQRTYKKTATLEPRIKEIIKTLELLNEIANEYDESDPKFLMFKKRMKQQKPPIDDSSKSPDWRAECIFCWNWSQDNSEKKVIDKLRHETWCNYSKKDFRRFLKIIKPSTSKN